MNVRAVRKDIRCCCKLFVINARITNVHVVNRPICAGSTSDVPSRRRCQHEFLQQPRFRDDVRHVRRRPRALRRHVHRDRDHHQPCLHRIIQPDGLRPRRHPVAPCRDSPNSDAGQLLCGARLAHGVRGALRRIPSDLLVRWKRIDAGARAEDESASRDAETAGRVRRVRSQVRRYTLPCRAVPLHMASSCNPARRWRGCINNRLYVCTNIYTTPPIVEYH